MSLPGIQGRRVQTAGGSLTASHSPSYHAPLGVLFRFLAQMRKLRHKG